MKLHMIILALLCLVPGQTIAKQLQVVAATNDLGAFAEAVTSGAAKIQVIARPDRDLHSLEVRPSMMTLVAKADVYLSVGLALDLWSDGVISGSRNRKLVVLKCADAITPLEVPVGKVDASMGDVHPAGNPHYWTDPNNAKRIASFLAKELGKLDAENAALFEKNAASFAAEIDARLPEWKKQLSGSTFIEFHRSWAYAARAFAMTIVDRVEPLPGIPPTPHHLAELTATIREKKVPVVIREVYHPQDPLDFLHRETGIHTAVLSVSCDAPTRASYLAHFDRIIKVMHGASS